MAENDDLVMIRNSKGEVLLQLVARSGVPKYKDFHDQELSDAIFDGLILEGAHFVGSNLARASFRNADLYWAMFIMANLEGASFREADLREQTSRKQIFRIACSCRPISAAIIWVVIRLSTVPISTALTFAPPI